MNVTQALKKLKAFGSEPTRKIYGRHGVQGEMYGVKYGDLAKLVKEIRRDQDLALELWASGIHDARVLATMIADPDAMTATILKHWVKDCDNYVLSMGVASIATKSAAGRKLMQTWMDARGEWVPATGWCVLAGVCGGPEPPTVAQCRKWTKVVEKAIHDSPNRVKYAMNTALIAMGTYVEGYEDEAVAAADRIGQVEVDHGLTNCETPLAAPYIRKAAAHHRKKRAKATKKAGSRKAAATKAPARKKAAPKKKATAKKAASKKPASKKKASKKKAAKRTPARKKPAAKATKKAGTRRKA
jgi:3-methyladenine DNA glycosylase AlkD